MPANDPWRCSWCGAHKPVPSMARDCERRHEAECGENYTDAPTPAAPD